MASSNISSSNNSQLPWIEKYRPQTLSEISDNDVKIKVLKSLIQSKSVPHLLFYGASGTGKTSTILAMAKDMFGLTYRNHILELNASDDRGIETVRSGITDFCKRSTKSEQGIKLIILDEVDSMTTDAQCALRRIIELYSKNTRFCLICNNINNIIEGLRSRCAEMKFSKISSDKSILKIKDIIKNENIQIDEEAINYLFNISGDFRKILNTLQCLHSINDKVIKKDDIENYLGIPSDKSLYEFMEIIKTNNLNTAHKKLIQIYKNNSWDLCNMVDKILYYLLDDKEINNKNDKEIIFSDDKKIKIIDRMSDVKQKINLGDDSEIHLCYLINAFY